MQYNRLHTQLCPITFAAILHVLSAVRDVKMQGQQHSTTVDCVHAHYCLLAETFKQTDAKTPQMG